MCNEIHAQGKDLSKNCKSYKIHAQGKDLSKNYSRSQMHAQGKDLGQKHTKVLNFSHKVRIWAKI